MTGRRRALLWTAGFTLLGILAAALSLYRAWHLTPAAGLGDTLLVLPRGLSSGQIAKHLAEAGVLESPRFFRWGTVIQGAAEELQAGRYRFPRPGAPAQILAMLRRGETEKLWFTLREGLWLDEAVGEIARGLGLDSLDLARRVRRPDHWDYDFLAGAQDLEGCLFPDTYAFEHPSDAATVLDHLLGACAEALAELDARLPADWPYSARENLILASIVEAEAQLDEERGRIAGVYLNRLRRGMRLEADPTVIYAHGRRLSRVFYKHLRLESPYNTYRHEGLPPGPICSPGAASLVSIIEADPSEKHLYFVATGDGGHRFAESLAEHRRNVANIRRGGDVP